MSIIDIDYDMLAIIVIALFALGGFMRGWWREGITTIFLILLVIFLTQPELANSIIEIVNGLLGTLFDLINRLLEPLRSETQVAAAAAEPPIVLDPNDRSLYVIILVIVVVVSYFTSKITLGGRSISAGARIFGGILGAINGFLSVNLLKEFIVGRFFPTTGLTAQTAAPDTLSIALSDVPPESAFANTSQLLVIGLGVIILALILANRVSTKGRRVPWGYK